MEIHEHSKHLTTLYLFWYETFIYLFEFKVFRYEERETHNFLLCWLFIHRQLSNHRLNQRAGIS